MNQRITYKRRVAGLFLCLFMLVSIPAALWHHHENQAGDDSMQFKAGSITGHEGPCPVCSTTFSVFDGAVSVPDEISLKIYTPSFSEDLFTLPVSFLHIGLIRGPPAC